MRGALSVRINDGYSDRIVTQFVKGLRFRKTAPGGHHSASCTVNLPRTAFVDLGPADKMYVYDTRTAATVWEGYTDNPGARDGVRGQSFDLSAAGGVVLTNDMATPLVFIERSLDDNLWTIHDAEVTPGGTYTTAGVTMLFQFPAGIPVGFLSRVVRQYVGALRTGQRILSVESSVRAGKSDAGYAQEVEVRAGTTVGSVVASIPFSTGSGPVSGRATVDFPIGADNVLLRIIRLGGATNVADDLTWGAFDGPYVRTILKSATGADVTDPAEYNASWVLGHEVVNHLLGALMPVMDGTTAQVDTATQPITQLTYHDGAKPQEILDDLSLYEPDYLWEVLESNTAGKHRFNYRAWPTSPRYEISVDDGYNAPGGDADLCNRVTVYWTDLNGAKQSTVVTSTVPALGARTRDASPITLPEGQGSVGNATRVGEQVLTQKASPPKSATATVSRPILDRLAGCWVMPWEIDPGYLVRVRETGDDLRLTEVEYTDDSTSASLTLGNPVRTVEQILARVG